MFDLQSLLKYLLEGLAVAVAVYLIPKKTIDSNEIALIALTAAAMFAVLDTFAPLIAVGAMYFAAWIKSRMVNRPARPAAESNLRDSLVILAIGVSLVALVSKIDTVGRWMANIPEFAIGALSLATWIKSRRQHPPGNPAAR